MVVLSFLSLAFSFSPSTTRPMQENFSECWLTIKHYYHSIKSFIVVCICCSSAPFTSDSIKLFEILCCLFWIPLNKTMPYFRQNNSRIRFQFEEKYLGLNFLTYFITVGLYYLDMIIFEAESAQNSQFQIASIFCWCTFLCSAFHKVHRCQFVIINKCTKTEVIDYLWKIDILAAKRNAIKLKMVFFMSLVDDLFDVWLVFHLFHFLSSIPSPFAITIGISIDLNVYFSCFQWTFHCVNCFIAEQIASKVHCK